MRIDLRTVAELTEKDRASLGVLNSAVYPPDVVAAWPGRSFEWAARQWSVIVWNDERTLALAHAGVLDRNVRLNQTIVKVGGIGGVMTHPEFRHQGIAKAAINRSVEFFRERGDFDFALLVCKPELIPFYERLGWQQFLGKLLVTQRGQSTEFTFNLPMIYSIRGQTEYEGVIDLHLRLPLKPVNHRQVMLTTTVTVTVVESTKRHDVAGHEPSQKNSYASELILETRWPCRPERGERYAPEHFFYCKC